MPPAAGAPPPARAGSRLAAGAAAGALVGLLAGYADAWRALAYFRGLPPHAHDAHSPTRIADFLLGGAAAALHYAPFLAVAGLLLALALGPVARRMATRRQELVVFAALFAVAFGAAAFWWTRERYYPGLPVASKQRLGVLALCLAAASLVGVTLGFVWARLPRGARRALAALHLVVWIAGAGYVVAEGRDARTRGAVGERNRDLPNVLFVLVDALRADVLGCYGNEAAHTPNIDRLARSGVVFERALVQAPYTWTSFGSFFTGKYPRRHGLVRMGPGQRLEHNVTLQEHLGTARRKDGLTLSPEDWAAAAFMTGALSHGSGLMGGFHGYIELMKGHPFVDIENRWSRFRSVLVGPSLVFKIRAKLDEDFLANEARRWLAAHEGRRFAAFVHLYSTHTPYDPPARWRERYVDPAYQGPFRHRFDAAMREVIERGSYTPTTADLRQIYDLYLGGVSHADHQVGLLVAELERQGVLDDTLIILTSDHGEDFGEGGRWEHNHMYNSNLEVPLLMAWPRGLPGGTRVSATVESIDVFPTVADLFGLELPEVRGPRDEIDGTSLLPLVRGEVERVRDHFFAEDSTYVAIQDDRTMLVLERFAVMPDGWEEALSSRVGRIRLHDLAEDPFQRRELFHIVMTQAADDASAEARAELRRRQRRVLEEADRLRAPLLEWNARMPIHVEAVVRSDRDEETERAMESRRAADLERLVSEGVTDDAELRRRMAALGYTQGFDDYRGELRDRVLERRRRRAESERADAGTK